MRRPFFFLTPLLLATLAVPARGLAQPPGRVSDAEVETVMKRIADGLGRFVDAMDPQMRTAILRNERGQVDMKAFLGDLRKSSDAMRSRFEPPRYSANTEALTFLAQARRLDDGIGRRPGMSGADPSWELLTPSLAALGGAYGVDWTTEPGSWAATRMSDADVKAALAGVEKKGEGLRKALEKDLKKDKSLDAAARAKALAPAVDLSATARQAASAFSKGEDVSPIVGRLLGSAGQLEADLAARKPAGVAASLWPALQGDLGKVAKGYGVASKN